MSTIESREAGDMRVLLVTDDWPSEPYNDGGTPVLFEEQYMGVKQVGCITSYVVPGEILHAYDRYVREQDDPDTFERYLRIFHGTTSVEWYWNRGKYVTFDTADWRAEMGLTDEYMAAHPEHFTGPLANMDEWKAYCEGDVYGVVIEERVTWTRFHGDGVTPFDTMQTWETVDSCFGFYGYEYALSEFEDACQRHLDTAAQSV